MVSTGDEELNPLPQYSLREALGNLTMVEILLGVELPGTHLEARYKGGSFLGAAGEVALTLREFQYCPWSSFRYQ